MPARELITVDANTSSEVTLRLLAEFKAHNKSLRRQITALLKQVHEARTEVNALKREKGDKVVVKVAGNGVQCPVCKHHTVAVFPTRYKTIYACKNDECNHRWLGELNGESGSRDSINVL